MFALEMTCAKHNIQHLTCRERITCCIDPEYDECGSSAIASPCIASRMIASPCHCFSVPQAVAIKSGIDFAGRQFNKPSKDMLFRNCTFASKHVSIGSEESGGVRNITVQDSTLGAIGDRSPGFNPGIHLKAERGRGGYIEDIVLERLQFIGPQSQPLFVSMFYSGTNNSKPPPKTICCVETASL